MPARTARQCLEKANELIGLAIPEPDLGRREGLLRLADQWVEVGDRRKSLDALASAEIRWRAGRCRAD